MRFFMRASLLAVAFLAVVSIANAQGPMTAMIYQNEAISWGTSAHSKLTSTQNTYEFFLDTYYNELTGYNDPGWTTEQRNSYRNADQQAGQIIYELILKGYFEEDLGEADSYFQSGMDYMSFSQWDPAFHAFYDCIAGANPTVDLDYAYNEYVDDYDNLYVPLCAWIQYMDTAKQ